MIKHQILSRLLVLTIILVSCKESNIFRVGRFAVEFDEKYINKNSFGVDSRVGKITTDDSLVISYDYQVQRMVEPDGGNPNIDSIIEELRTGEEGLASIYPLDKYSYKYKVDGFLIRQYCVPNKFNGVLWGLSFDARDKETLILSSKVGSKEQFDRVMKIYNGITLTDPNVKSDFLQ